MIIIKLIGGLGNQLFQYACGRALSLKNNDVLKFDTSGYEKTTNSDTPRNYLLDRFNIENLQIASIEEINSIGYPYGILSKLNEYIRTKVLRKFNVGFHPEILKKQGDIFLKGFWQSERYFKEIEHIIRKELTLKSPYGDQAAKMMQIIESQHQSVSIHVRRGDVARDAKTNLYYGIANKEYYNRALEYISEKVNDLHIFVFSDDIDWVKENIKTDLPTTYVSGNAGIKDYEELSLMSKCDHNIIANSSFSWWGAWLNTNPNKIVIAPKRWITKNEDWHKDTVPETWIRI